MPIEPSYVDEETLLGECERIASAAQPYFEGGILPSEMALWLAACKATNVDFIVESGRQDGYSTAVIADFVEGTGIGFASIDRVMDPARGAAAIERLAGRPVELLEGDVRSVLPAAIPPDCQRVAFLVDGPKRWTANRLLLAAAAAFPIALIGLHGHASDTPAGRELEMMFRDTTLASFDGEAFAEFCAWEETHLGSRDGLRPLRPFTLGIARVAPQETRRRRLLAHSRGRGALESVLFPLARSRPIPAWWIARRWPRRSA